MNRQVLMKKVTDAIAAGPTGYFFQRASKFIVV